jgi:hypothetical protein
MGYMNARNRRGSVAGLVRPQHLVEPQRTEGPSKAYADCLAPGLNIPSLCILALKALGWRPNIAAAISFPAMRYRVSARILEICVCNASSIILVADDIAGDEIFSLSASCRTDLEHRITILNLQPVNKYMRK